MVKFGITSSGPRATAALARENVHRGWWPFAYTLLPELRDQDDEALIERLYRSIQASAGVYKITALGRFRELDDFLAKEVKKRSGGGMPIHIHDMAASNGITSLELFDILNKEHNVHLYASDYFNKLYIASLAGSGWQVIFDADLNPLQFVGYGMVLSGYRKEPARYPVNRLVQRIVRHLVLPRARAVARRANAQGPRNDDEGDLQCIPLFHPRCVAAARKNPRFSLGKENLFQPTPGQYHVIRVMNALTTHHFPLDRVLQGILAISSNLTQGGLLLLGRNVDEVDGRLRATVFARQGAKLIGIHDLSEGYELRSEVEGLRISDDAK